MSLQSIAERDEAKAAREASKRHLLEAIEQGVEVRQVAESLRDLRTRNHFADMIERSMYRP